MEQRAAASAAFRSSGDERMAGRAFIGTSGWIYGSWRDDLYEGRPASEWLGLCTARFTAIKINAMHYRLRSSLC